MIPGLFSGSWWQGRRGVENLLNLWDMVGVPKAVLVIQRTIVLVLQKQTMATPQTMREDKRLKHI